MNSPFLGLPHGGGEPSPAADIQVFKPTSVSGQQQIWTKPVGLYKVVRAIVLAAGGGGGSGEKRAAGTVSAGGGGGGGGSIVLADYAFDMLLATEFVVVGT